MNEKIVAFGIVAAVLVVGFAGLVDVGKANSGAAVIERSCCCELQKFDYYGKLTVTDDLPPIRVQTAEQHTDAACTNRCDQFFGSPHNKVVGTAC
jgi:hypothetical protein